MGQGFGCRCSGQVVKRADDAKTPLWLRFASYCQVLSEITPWSASSMFFPLYPAFAEEPGTSTPGPSVRMWKVDSKNPRVFLVMQSANSGWWFITGWESVHNWEHKQSQCILLSWVLCPCLFHTVFIWKKIALLSFSNFLTFYTHFAPILCQDEWDSQGQTREEKWSRVWDLWTSGSFMDTNWMWIKCMFTFLSHSPDIPHTLEFPPAAAEQCYLIQNWQHLIQQKDKAVQTHDTDLAEVPPIQS